MLLEVDGEVVGDHAALPVQRMCLTARGRKAAGGKARHDTRCVDATVGTVVRPSAIRAAGRRAAKMRTPGPPARQFANPLRGTRCATVPQTAMRTAILADTHANS